MEEAKAWVMIPHSRDKGTKIEIKIKPLVLCEELQTGTGVINMQPLIRRRRRETMNKVEEACKTLRDQVDVSSEEDALIIASSTKERYRIEVVGRTKALIHMMVHAMTDIIMKASNNRQTVIEAANIIGEALRASVLEEMTNMAGPQEADDE